MCIFPRMLYFHARFCIFGKFSDHILNLKNVKSHSFFFISFHIVFHHYMFRHFVRNKFHDTCLLISSAWNKALWIFQQFYSTHYMKSDATLIAMQAFVNLVLTLCDAGDSVVMFAPYYFNAYMSFQMTGITNILVGPGNPKTLYPDAGKIKKLPNLLILYELYCFWHFWATS